jgi:hypothetical protein
LLVESGEVKNAGRRFQRVFLARIGNAQPILDSFAELPSTFKNVEGSAVAKLGDRMIFVCAERGDHRSSTEVY